MACRPRVLLIGASVRAAAWSALRAGFAPCALDLFADADLAMIAEVHPWSQRERVLAATVGMPRVAVSDAVLAERRDASGRGDWFAPDDWDAARDLTPLARSGLPWLQTRTVTADGPWPDDGDWFVKPIVSGGGQHVVRWKGGTPRPHAAGPVMLQAAATGVPCSALYLAELGRAELLGTTRQLVGLSPPALAPFAYHGSIAPLEFPPAVMETLRQIGAVLAPAQRGLFGVDFLWDGETPWPIEINPRYTAAIELLEWATGRALFAEHVRACGGVLPNASHPAREPAGRMLGKRILYAATSFIARDPACWLARRDPWSIPFVADLPTVGTRFEPGLPVCTVYATGMTSAEVEGKLTRRAKRIRRWLGDFPERRNDS